jgi:hypothetical protein
MITITKGSVSAKQLENEFRGPSGPHSTWRWFAKGISDNVFQMRFPIAKKIDDIAFFAGMEMRIVPTVSFKVEKWNANAGAKAGLDTAWFRILGILSVFNRLPTEGYTQGGKFWVRSRRDQELESARNTKLRQVQAAKCVIPYVLYGLYCLWCRITCRSSVSRGVPVLPYISERPGLQRY